MTDFRALALESGFTVAEPIDVKTLKFLPDVRSMCAADRCQSYGKTWSCPPACGELSDWEEKASHFSKGLVIQTVGDREDSYDFEAMMEVAEENKRQFDVFTEKLRAMGADFLAMSAGTCTRCEKCTYPDAPCRFPEKLYPSMEASGLFVSGVCSDNGIKYYSGDDKIAYTCCLLYN